MEPRDALLLLSWVALTILTVGVIGLARAVNMLHSRIAEGVVGPRRLTAGDTVQLPSGLRESLTQDAVLILFVTAGCQSCVQAVKELKRYVE